MRKRLRHLPLKKQLNILIFTTVIPLTIIGLYLLYALLDYSRAYQSIVSNISTANQYSQAFKPEMDEDIYRIVVSGKTFEEITGDQDLEDPYAVLDGCRKTFTTLQSATRDEQSLRWLQVQVRNIDTLRERVDDIRESCETGDNYDENIAMLNSDVYILTALIQEDIQTYIYYQVKYMDLMRVAMEKRVVTFITVMVLVLGASVAASSVLARRAAASIAVPIRELSQVTHEIAGGDFSARAEVSGSVDIELLQTSVNDMASHLEVMVRQIREDERKMRKADLRLLQEQINPHFLYNSLDAIVWLIEDRKYDEAEDMVVSLSRYFRLSLSKGREFISIRDEEQHIRSYLEIQQVRYHDILQYEIDIDPSLYQYRIMKLTLQPLVENALYHGIKNKRSGGTIRVTGRKEGSLVRLSVEDNGAGMDEKELASLREEIAKPCSGTTSGFGMANVNERIRMNFGPSYGLYLESQKDVGTTVTVTIPAQPLEEKTNEEADHAQTP